MSSVWSNRPQFLHLGLFVAAYVMGCAFAQVLAIVPGITVSIWPPAGVFIATLILTSAVQLAVVDLGGLSGGDDRHSSFGSTVHCLRAF